MRGYGNKQLYSERLTIRKIVETLATKPYTYEQLRADTKIQRNILRRRLDYLAYQEGGMIIRYKYLFYQDMKNDYTKPNAEYYILNLNNPKIQEILYVWPQIFADPKGYFSRQEYLENLRRYGLGFYYYTKEERQHRIKELEEKVKKNQEEIIHHFQEQENTEQETGFAEIKRPFATSIIELAYLSVNDGYSPLSALIYHTCGEKSSTWWYEFVWNLLENSGFLKKYVFNTIV